VTSASLKKQLAWAIKEIPHTHVVLVPDGEAAKEWGQVQKLLQRFVELELDRGSILVALGGGSVGDLVGFAASLYLRGIRYVQVPTTLLAQVDSAHGGKTGVNFLGYKNQIGTIYLPLATIVDTRFLQSLKQEQIIDGLGEIIKAGLIKDSTILLFLKSKRVTTLTRDSQLLMLVKKAVAVKLFYVRKDPSEHGIRKMLNAGHTIGHAIELKYKLTHGRAVLIGLWEELSFCESLGLTPPDVGVRYAELLKSLGIKFERHLSVDWGSLRHDKKVTGDMVDFPVVKKEGESKIVKIKLSALKAYLKQIQT